MRPFGELGGTTPLYFIEALDIMDKHRLLVPSIDETTVTFQHLASIDKTCPYVGIGHSVTLSDQAKIEWRNDLIPPVDELGIRISEHEFKRILDVPVNIIFEIEFPFERNVIHRVPVIHALYKMLDIARQVITCMRNAA